MEKVLILIDHPLDKIGGAQKSTITFIDEIKDKYDIYILSPFFDKNISGIDDDKIICWGNPYNKITSKMSRYYFLYKTVNEIKPEIIHSQFSQYGLSLMVCNYFNILKGARCYFTDRDFFSAYSKKYKFLFKKLASKMEGIICTTNINRELWDREVKNLNKTIVIPNVLDREWYEYDVNKRNSIRKNNHDRIVVGFSGRFVDWKRWFDIIEICRSLSDNQLFEFHFALSSTTNRVDMMNYIDNLKMLLGDKCKISIDVCESEMQMFYYSLDIFVLASENESFGRTLIEAMTKKVIVIGTNSGGVPDVILKKENLFNVADIKGAVNIISNYCDDADLMKKDKEYFYNIVNSVFTKEYYSSVVEDIYN